MPFKVTSDNCADVLSTIPVAQQVVGVSTVASNLAKSTADIASLTFDSIKVGFHHIAKAFTSDVDKKTSRQASIEAIRLHRDETATKLGEHAKYIGIGALRMIPVASNIFSAKRLDVSVVDSLCTIPVLATLIGLAGIIKDIALTILNVVKSVINPLAGYVRSKQAQKAETEAVNAEALSAAAIAAVAVAQTAVENAQIDLADKELVNDMDQISAARETLAAAQATLARDQTTAANALTDAQAKRTEANNKANLKALPKYETNFKEVFADFGSNLCRVIPGVGQIYSITRIYGQLPAVATV